MNSQNGWPELNMLKKKKEKHQVIFQIFNRELEAQRPHYTILGILIFIQLGISFLIFLKQTFKALTQKPEQPQA